MLASPLGSDRRDHTLFRQRSKETNLMLVLSRKVGEQIVIDDNIVVTVLQLKGKRVQIGILAPSHVNIRREELSVHTDNTSREMVGSSEESAGTR